MCITSGMLSFIATIIIGGFQICQNCRANKREKEQDEKENRRFNESIEMQTRYFLSKYNDTIRLLPLCAIAFAYDANRPYTREMYSEFRLLSKDVRTKIFERCGWKMCDVQSDDFYGDCLNCLEEAFKENCPQENFLKMFYEKGKYLEKTIRYYGKEKIQPPNFFDTKKLNDIFRMSYGKNTTEVLEQIIRTFGFRSFDEKSNCQLVCYVAQCISEYSTTNELDNDIYGYPGDGNNEQIETMEDLFLLTLFEIWANLMDVKQ